MRGDPGDSPAVAPQQPFRPMRDTPDGSDDTDDREERDGTQAPASQPEPKGTPNTPISVTNRPGGGRVEPPEQYAPGPVEGTIPPTDDPQSSEARSPQRDPRDPQRPGCPPGMVRQGVACVDEGLSSSIQERTRGYKKRQREAKQLIQRITPRPISGRQYAALLARRAPQLRQKKYRKVLLDIGSDLATIVNARRKLQVYQRAAQARPDLATFIDSRIRGAQQQIRTRAQRLKNRGLF